MTSGEIGLSMAGTEVLLIQRAFRPARGGASRRLEELLAVEPQRLRLFDQSPLMSGESLGNVRCHGAGIIEVASRGIGVISNDFGASD